MKQMKETLQHQRVRFMGNVELQTTSQKHNNQHENLETESVMKRKRKRNQVRIETLRKHYNAVVLATGGAAKDRKLHLPGEDTFRNLVSARQFVAWYNSDPEQYERSVPQFDLKNTEEVTIVGQGNVAADCARILLSPIDALRNTDISQDALDRLAESKVRRVRLVGRRGPAQIAITASEIRELIHLPDAALYADTVMINKAKEGYTLDRPKKRIISLMLEGANDPTRVDKSKAWHLDFLLSPQALHPNKVDPQVLDSVTFARNRLDPLTMRAQPTEETMTWKTPLLLRSIGYEAQALQGIPFDVDQSIVPNIGGKVMDYSVHGSIIPGLYVTGWLKTGPRGVIVNAMMDAYETADMILNDFALEALQNDECSHWIGVKHDSHIEDSDVVDYARWKRIEQEEQKRGEILGKPAEKLQRVQDMLGIE